MTDLTNPIYTDENAARAHLEAIRWPEGPVCPYCGTLEATKKLGGQSMGEGWYHCTACRKKYTVRVGTVYERSHVPLHKWVLATHLLSASKKGMSAHQLHRMLGVSYKTAWFMAHRIRESMIDTTSGPLGGEGKTIEADETYFGKGEEAKAYKNVKLRGAGGKRAVVALVERGGRSKAIHARDLTQHTIRHILVTNSDRKSDLRTDERNLYPAIGKEYASHKTVNHSRKEYGRGEVHTNTIEGYFSIFKRGMKGIYQHCGEQHLQRYLNEFDFRYSNRAITDFDRATIAHKGAEGKRLTYRRINESEAP